MIKSQTSIPVIDPTFPEALFQIRDKIYSLRFDFDAVSVFQSGTGINLVTDSIDLSVINLVAALNAGLLYSHPTISFDEIKPWVTIKTAQQLWKIVLQAIRESAPDPDPTDTEGQLSPDPPSA